MRRGIPIVGKLCEGRAGTIRRRVLAVLERDGELPTTMVCSAVEGTARRFTRAEIERCLCDLLDEGLVVAARRMAPLYHGARNGREWTYWRPAGGPAEVAV
jgi:hypothetical protein